MKKETKKMLLGVGIVLGIIFLIILILFIIYKISTSTAANTTKETQEEKVVTLYIFKKDSCSYCQKALNYLTAIKPSYPYLEVITYEASNGDNRTLMSLVAEALDIENKSSVPLIVVGSYSLRGFADRYKNTLNEEILKAYQDNEYTDIVAQVIEDNSDLEIVAETLLIN